MYFDAHFWSHYFLSVFAKQVKHFHEVLTQRVLPQFETASEEADEVADMEFERLGNIRSSDGDPALDEAQAAEASFEAGLAHYEMLVGVRQTFLNLAVAALYHMFEQQLLFFHRRQVLSPQEEYALDHDPTLNGPTLNDLRELDRRLASAGVRRDELACWKAIEELKLAANAIKHGEGSSARRLHRLRPELFLPESRRDTPPDMILGTAAQPLAGQDIYITQSDLERYRDALCEFWRDFGNALRGVQAAAEEAEFGDETSEAAN